MNCIDGDTSIYVARWRDSLESKSDSPASSISLLVSCIHQSGRVVLRATTRQMWSTLVRDTSQICMNVWFMYMNYFMFIMVWLGRQPKSRTRGTKWSCLQNAKSHHLQEETSHRLDFLRVANPNHHVDWSSRNMVRRFVFSERKDSFVKLKQEGQQGAGAPEPHQQYQRDLPRRIVPEVRHRLQWNKP